MPIPILLQNIKNSLFGEKVETQTQSVQTKKTKPKNVETSENKPTTEKVNHLQKLKNIEEEIQHKEKSNSKKVKSKDNSMSNPFIFPKKMTEDEVRKQIEAIQYKYQLKARSFDDSDYVWNLAKYHLHADEEIKYYFTGNSSFGHHKHHNKVGFKVRNTDPDRESQLFRGGNQATKNLEMTGMFSSTYAIITNKRVIINANGIEFSINYPAFSGGRYGNMETSPMIFDTRYTTIYDEFEFYLVINQASGNGYEIPIGSFDESDDAKNLMDLMVNEWVPSANAYWRKQEGNYICPSYLEQVNQLPKDNSKNQEIKNTNTSNQSQGVGNISEAVINQLKQLHELKQAGILTDDEFNSKKKQLLDL